MKILLTAFEPFGGQTINASQETARSLQGHQFEGAHLEILDLPVARFTAIEVALEAIARLQPNLVIMLGEAGGRAAVTPERVAINVDSFPIPDNAGAQPQEEFIIDNGPVAYFSTLPIVPIVQALAEARISAAISNTAGTYLCNHLFYGVQHYIHQENLPIRAGFIHIPIFPEQIRRNSGVEASLPRETVAEAVKIAVQTCLNQSS